MGKTEDQIRVELKKLNPIAVQLNENVTTIAGHMKEIIQRKDVEQWKSIMEAKLTVNATTGSVDGFTAIYRAVEQININFARWVDIVSFLFDAQVVKEYTMSKTQSETYKCIELIGQLRTGIANFGAVLKLDSVSPTEDELLGLIATSPAPTEQLLFWLAIADTRPEIVAYAEAAKDKLLGAGWFDVHSLDPSQLPRLGLRPLIPYGSIVRLYDTIINRSNPPTSVFIAVRELAAEGPVIVIVKTPVRRERTVTYDIAALTDQDYLIQNQMETSSYSGINYKWLKRFSNIKSVDVSDKLPAEVTVLDQEDFVEKVFEGACLGSRSVGDPPSLRQPTDASQQTSLPTQDNEAGTLGSKRELVRKVDFTTPGVYAYGKNKMSLAEIRKCTLPFLVICTNNMIDWTIMGDPLAGDYRVPASTAVKLLNMITTRPQKYNDMIEHNFVTTAIDQKFNLMTDSYREEPIPMVNAFRDLVMNAIGDPAGATSFIVWFLKFEPGVINLAYSAILKTITVRHVSGELASTAIALATKAASLFTREVRAKQGIARGVTVAEIKKVFAVVFDQFVAQKTLDSLSLGVKMFCIHRME
jgi:hypothetical protein